jgi:hypothetical protein
LRKLIFGTFNIFFWGFSTVLNNLNKKDVRYNNASTIPEQIIWKLVFLNAELPFQRVIFVFDVGAQAAYIDAAIQEWQRLTCVTFQKRQSTDNNQWTISLHTG